MDTIILDDEKPAIEILSTFASKVPFVDIKLATTNPYDALELLSSQKIDLLLLDIEMPDLSGVEFVKSLGQKPLIIFTTAYEEYALEGYELDIVDYLVKPIRLERFLKAINKANRLYNLNKNQIVTLEEKYLTIKVEYKTVKIAKSDVLYIEGLKDYVKIYTNDKMYLTRLNLKGIENKLPSNDFLRIHRSYIVARKKITAFNQSEISIGNQDFSIGFSYQGKVNKLLK